MGNLQEKCRVAVRRLLCPESGEIAGETEDIFDQLQALLQTR